MHKELYHLVSTHRLERLQNLIEEAQELIIDLKYECDGYLNISPPPLVTPRPPPLPTEEELPEIF